MSIALRDGVGRFLRVVASYVYRAAMARYEVDVFGRNKQNLVLACGIAIFGCHSKMLHTTQCSRKFPNFICVKRASAIASYLVG